MKKLIFTILISFFALCSFAQSQPTDSTQTAAKSSSESSKWTLRLVTGGNFDFFNGPTIKNFAGDLTAFIPTMFHIGKLKIGMDFGINNYHYFNNDSSNIKPYNQSYFLNYKDFYNSNDSSKVVKSSQNNNGKYDYSVWGIHLDPTVQILKNDDESAQLYVKLHFEELATTVTYTPNLGAPINDTITLQQYHNTYKSLQDPTAHSMPLSSYSQKTYYDYYVGAGLSVSLKIGDIATLYISPSAGLAMIHKADSAFVDDPIHRDLIRNGHSSNESKLYTLNKFQLVTTASAVNIALGGEYRTVANNMHYFTTYIGASFPLDKLKK